KNTSIEARDRDLDMENKQKKNLKASYGITTQQELRRNQIKEEISHHHNIGDDVDINTLTMKQYLALIQDNIRQGVVKPKIGNAIKFEINNNFMRELRRKLFKGKKDIKDLVPRDLPVVHPYVPPAPFTGHLKEQQGNFYKTRKTVCMIGIPQKIHIKKAQEDKVDMDDGWDIKVKDVERLRQILTPIIHTLPNLEPVVQPYMPLRPVHDEEKVIREEDQDYDIPLQDGVRQPLTPQTVHITLPDEDYVAPATNPILDKNLNEFGKEFLI
ncbi:hypothetical protein Tco_0775284, partial [Tanacetum coccineum]